MLLGTPALSRNEPPPRVLVADEYNDCAYLAYDCTGAFA